MGGQAADEGGITMYVLHCYSSLSRGESAYREMAHARCGSAASHQSQVHAAQLPAPNRYSSLSRGESAYREMTRARCGAAAADQSLNLRCTLRNFPHLIDHCIEWARDKFAEVRSTAAGWLARASRRTRRVSPPMPRRFRDRRDGGAHPDRVSPQQQQHDSA